MKKITLISILLAVLIFTGAACTSQPAPPSDAEQACPGVWKETEPLRLTGEKLEIPLFYTIPQWYLRQMDFVDIKQSKFGNEIEVYAKMMPWLQDMENIDVKFNLPEGLTLISGKTEWQGNIKKCEVKEFALKVKWTSQPEETQRLKM